MLSQAEFERVIRAFLVELNHRCLNVSEAEIRALPLVAAQVDQCVADLRNPEYDSAQLLYTAFSYLDFYCYADWEPLMSSTYESYKGSGGENGGE